MTILELAAAVTSLVEFARTALLRVGRFARLDGLGQSVILQVIAAVIGAFLALLLRVNVFTTTDPVVGTILTGLIASTGSAAMHVILAALGIRAGVSAEMQRRLTAEASIESTYTYTPFL